MLQITGEVITPIILTLVMLWFLWVWLKRSRSPGMLMLRWGLTAAVMGYLFYHASRLAQSQGKEKAFIVIYAAFCGLIMAIIWVPSIVDAVGRMFGSLYDGGSVEIEPKPYYSIFQTKRTQGKYQEALAEVRKQLEKFPNDLEGMLWLAELQAEDLNDLPGADLTIHRLCQFEGRTPKNIAYSLNKLADWYLNLHKDRDSAQRILQEILDLLPETEMSLQASQRIAHLAGTEMLLAPEQRRGVRISKGAEYIGLMRDQEHLKPTEQNQGEIAAALVNHLELHPLDGDARERLAIIYANHFERLDLAKDQLDQLIEQPNQPGKNVVRWLNLLADLQVHGGCELGVVRATLQRILDLYPEAAAAKNAERRMEMLKLEVRGKEKSQAVKPLGSYEQYLGLKKRA